jgi:hypothetical protein
MDNICKNCGFETTENYCARCGQATQTKRFDWPMFLQEFIFNNFTLHKGLLFTIKSLILHPKQVIEDYLAGKRAKYTGAVQFFLFILLCYGLLILFKSELGIHQPQKIVTGYANTKIDISGWMKSMRLLIIVVSSFLTYMIYRNKKYYLAEHFIVNFYIWGISSLLGEVIMLITFYKLERGRALIGCFIIISYYIRIFYNEKIWIIDYIKGIICFLLSVVAYKYLFKLILMIYQSGLFK